MGILEFLETFWEAIVALWDGFWEFGAFMEEQASLFYTTNLESWVLVYMDLRETLSQASVWTVFLSKALIYSTPILAFQLLRGPDIIQTRGAIDYRQWLHVLLGFALVAYNFRHDLLDDPAIAPQPHNLRQTSAQWLDCIEPACLSLLLMLNYRRALTPSFALSAYLAGSIINKLAILITGPPTTFDTFTSSRLCHISILHFLMLCLHEFPKLDNVALDLRQHAGTQSFYGLFGNSFGIWLHPTFHLGSNRLLAVDDFNGLPNELLVHKMIPELHRHRSHYRGHPSELAKACFSLRWKDVSLAMIGNVVYLMLETSTPKLVEQAVFIQQSWLDPSKTVPGTWTKSSLLCMTLAILLGISMSRGFAIHCESRATTAMQGAILGTVFSKLLALSEDTIEESARVSILSTDVPEATRLIQSYLRSATHLGKLFVILAMLWPHLGYLTLAVLAISIVIYRTIRYLRSEHPTLLRELNSKREKREMHVSRLLYKLKEVAMTERGPAFHKVMNDMRDDELMTYSTYHGKQARVYTFLISSTSLFPSLVLAASWMSPGPDGAFNLAAMLKCFLLLAIWSENSEPVLLEIAGYKQALSYMSNISTFLNLPELSADYAQAENINDETFDPNLSEANMVELRNVDVAASHDAEAILKHINISFQKQSLSIIAGKSGSGKSVLAKSLLSHRILRRGVIAIHESARHSIAFCGQRSWLQSRSIKANIIGFKPFEQKWYDEVIQACALKEDLARYPGGDSFILGRHGLHLNEAERQKIAIARALYSRAKLVVFDDPFDILDCFTAEAMINRLLGPNGKFENTQSTVVLMTRDPAPFCDIAREVFEISNDGEISLKSKIDIQKQAEIRRNQSMTASEDIEQDVIQFQPRAAPRGATLQLSHRPRHNKSHMAPLSFYYSYADTTLILAWHTSVIALVLLFLSFQILVILGYAATPDSYYSSIAIVVAGLLSGPAMANAGYSFYGKLAVQVSGKLYTELLNAVTRAPLKMSDPNNLPNVILLFNEGMRVITIDLPHYIFQSTYQLLVCITLIGILSCANPYVLVGFPFICMLAYGIKDIYVATSRQIHSLQLDSNATLQAHFVESAAGVSYVEAFQWKENQLDEILEAVDNQQRVLYHSLSTKQWLVVVGNVFVAISCMPLLSFVFTSTTSPACVGIAFGSCFYLQYIIQMAVIPWFHLDDGLTTLQEIKELIETEEEPVLRYQTEAPGDAPINAGDEVPVDPDAGVPAQPAPVAQAHESDPASFDKTTLPSTSVGDTAMVEQQGADAKNKDSGEAISPEEHDSIPSSILPNTLEMEGEVSSDLALTSEADPGLGSSKSRKGKERANTWNGGTQPEIPEQSGQLVYPEQTELPEIPAKDAAPEMPGEHVVPDAPNNDDIPPDNARDYVPPNPNVNIQVPTSWPTQGLIEFRDVTIWYNSRDHPMLKDISLTIYDNTEAGLHGSVGSGKTALLLAILNMLPYQGSITIDGIEVKTIPSPDLRARINVIPQEVILLPGSVRQNLKSDEFFLPPNTIVIPGQGVVKAYSDILERILKRLALWGIIESCGGLDADIFDIPLTPTQEYKFSIAQALTRFFFTQSKVTLVDNVTSLVPHGDCIIMRQAMRELINDGSILAVGQHQSAVIGSDAIGEIKYDTTCIQERAAINSVGDGESSRGRARQETAYPLPWSKDTPKLPSTSGPLLAVEPSGEEPSSESYLPSTTRASSPIPGPSNSARQPSPTPDTSDEARSASPTPRPSEIVRSLSPTLESPSPERSPYPVPESLRTPRSPSATPSPPCTARASSPIPLTLSSTARSPSPESEPSCASVPPEPELIPERRGRSRRARPLDDGEERSRSLTPRASRTAISPLEDKVRSRSLTPRASRTETSPSEADRSRSSTPTASRVSGASSVVKHRSWSVPPRSSSRSRPPSVVRARSVPPQAELSPTDESFSPAPEDTEPSHDLLLLPAVAYTPPPPPAPATEAEGEEESKKDKKTRREEKEEESDYYMARHYERYQERLRKGLRSTAFWSDFEIVAGLPRATGRPIPEAEPLPAASASTSEGQEGEASSSAAVQLPQPPSQPSLEGAQPQTETTAAALTTANEPPAGSQVLAQQANVTPPVLSPLQPAYALNASDVANLLRSVRQEITGPVIPGLTRSEKLMPSERQIKLVEAEEELAMADWTRAEDEWAQGQPLWVRAELERERTEPGYTRTRTQEEYLAVSHFLPVASEIESETLRLAPIMHPWWPTSSPILGLPLRAARRPAQPSPLRQAVSIDCLLDAEPREDLPADPPVENTPAQHRPVQHRPAQHRPAQHHPVQHRSVQRPPVQRPPAQQRPARPLLAMQSPPRRAPPPPPGPAPDVRQLLLRGGNLHITPTTGPNTPQGQPNINVTSAHMVTNYITCMNWLINRRLRLIAALRAQGLRIPRRPGWPLPPPREAPPPLPEPARLVRKREVLRKSGPSLFYIYFKVKFSRRINARRLLRMRNRATVRQQ